MTADTEGTPIRSGSTGLLAVIAAVAVVIVIVGATVAVFLNPLWIGFEQERAGVPAITGFTPEQVQSVSASILADLIFGPPEFAVTVDGQPVLGAAERSHMVDVRGVLLPFLAVVLAGTAALVAIVATNRRDPQMWRAIALGAGVLALIGIVVGAAVVFFFDAAFLLFHLVVFPQGNFSFDPRIQRLTQLFPGQFWADSATGIAIVGLAIALAITLFARRQTARLSRD